MNYDKIILLLKTLKEKITKDIEIMANFVKGYCDGTEDLKKFEEKKIDINKFEV